MYLYTRGHRIVKTDEFSSVFRFGQMYRTTHFLLYLCENNFMHARLGIVIAKRLVPHAVTRNVIKRISRELFRKKINLCSLDCIVRLFQPLNDKYRSTSHTVFKLELYKELSQLFSFALNYNK